MADLINELKGLSANARKLKDSLLELAKIDLQKTVSHKVFTEKRPQMVEILLEELGNAIYNFPEYNTSLFSDRLMSVFDNPEIIILTPDLHIRVDAEGVAGTYTDFYDGVVGARISLGLNKTGRFSPEQRANYWRDFIYIPARGGMSTRSDRRTYTKAPSHVRSGQKKAAKRKFGYLYTETMNTRLAEWGDLAPYWTLLEYGNVSSGGAYPTAAGTGFRAKAEEHINAFYRYQIRIAMEELERELIDYVDSLFDTAVLGGMPIQAGDILHTFMIGGREYKSYITPTGFVGGKLT